MPSRTRRRAARPLYARPRDGRPHRGARERQGPGVPPEEREQIFEPFHTAASAPASASPSCAGSRASSAGRSVSATPGAAVRFLLRLPAAQPGRHLPDRPAAAGAHEDPGRRRRAGHPLRAGPSCCGRRARRARGGARAGRAGRARRRAGRPRHLRPEHARDERAALLEEVRARHPDTLFILLTAHGDERVAVEALPLGAFTTSRSRSTTTRSSPSSSGRGRCSRCGRRTAPARRAERRHSPASSAARRRCASAAHRAARRTDRRDRADHRRERHGQGGRRPRAARWQPPRARPFIALNCSALPGRARRVELFGHVRGAFTGADRDRDGLFAAADGGTLFLDEIGELAPPRRRSCCARWRSAASRPSARRAAWPSTCASSPRRTGRSDDARRARRVPRGPALPPQRRAAAAAAAARAARGHPRSPLTSSHTSPSGTADRRCPSARAARRALLAHDWPGNVRELRNAIERAVVLAEGDAIEPHDLPACADRQRAPLRPGGRRLAELPWADARARALESFERSFLAAALERHGGNVSATARALGLHRQSLQKMLRVRAASWRRASRCRCDFT
jgi:hypothetical protein